MDSDLIAQTLDLPKQGVASVIRLLDEQATVPFIARYRKEATQGLDEVQIRAVRDERDRVVELDKRRKSVLSAIEEQGQLTSALRDQLMKAQTKAALEDLYLPYKRKRTTRAGKARAAGLEPLARQILGQRRDGHPARHSAEELQGARDIVAEIVSEDPPLRRDARELTRRHGRIESSLPRGKKSGERDRRFEQYENFSEQVARIPSHRYLAMARGEAAGELSVKLTVEWDRLRSAVLRGYRLDRSSPWAPQLEQAVDDGWKRLIFPAVEREVHSELKLRSDEAAVEVFARNLRNLLLQAPLGPRGVLAIDPGLRTGCKCVALDATGRLAHHFTIYPARGGQAEERAGQDLLESVRRYKPAAIAVGNGTGGRETMTLAKAALKDAGLDDVILLEVNESGASVYSASDVAREEFPDLDVTVRGAVSIGRRLQDPLAELVKIDPKSIGVGQYQHDVQQTLLHKKLGEVVESCVNHVGVSLNTASAPLLSHVSGIGPRLAKSIVDHREKTGRFSRRADLLKVAGLGKRTYEQAAGFLRLQNGKEPLDGSAVHPERYDLVRRMAGDIGVPVAQLVGNTAAVQRIEVGRYTSAEVGEPTLRDILTELARPGRDPRADFEPPKRRDDVTSVNDLHEGMVLQGQVTNVTNFGAFVDIGVKQDGLVHVSELADRFVRDPHEVAAVGQRLQVRVLKVDQQRQRISLSAKGLGNG